MAASKKMSSKVSSVKGKGASSAKSAAKAAARAAVVKKPASSSVSPVVAKKLVSSRMEAKSKEALQADLWGNLKETVRGNPAMAVVMTVAVLLAFMLMFD